LTRVTGEPIVIAGWLVDPTALQIKQADKFNKIDPSAMAVLEYLAGRQGKVVSRQELNEVIWAGTEVDDEAIGATILELRQAFGDSEQDAKIIETISGTGYRLIGRVTFMDANGVPVSTNPRNPDSPNVGLTAATRSAAVNQLRTNEWRMAAFFVILLMIAVAFWLEPWGRRFEPASIAEMKSPLPDKPSIVVLPLSNPSEDPEQENFIDAMTDDLITGLSKHPGLFVIARNSILAYKNQKVEIRDVAHSHGVRYVLEGSVRRAGVRLRINVRLIDALSGDRIWEETFDGVLDDRVRLQDDLSRGIVEQLAPD
jgi:TolB-like protein/DNA-binding winged helix-turn-helix (wHTH) protein